MINCIMRYLVLSFGFKNLLGDWKVSDIMGEDSLQYYLGKDLYIGGQGRFINL